MNLQDPVGPAYLMFTIVGIIVLFLIVDLYKNDFKKDKNKS
jgi:hypothetical protein